MTDEPVKMLKTALGDIPAERLSNQDVINHCEWAIGALSQADTFMTKVDAEFEAQGMRRRLWPAATKTAIVNKIAAIKAFVAQARAAMEAVAAPDEGA
ncbi:MAG: hypothetical protein BPHS0_22 [Phage 5P_3]|nr:MAG: hypothetical protein BPHS0_22 [Phage 5P_3]